MNNFKKINRLPCFLLFIFCTMRLFFIPPLSAAADISVDLLLDRQEVTVGESLAMQLRINGANSAAAPDLSQLADFHVQERGGQSTSSTSVTNMNGKWQRVTQLGYIFSYTLTPKRAGALTIPPVDVKVDGKSHQTKPVTLIARQPEETEDLKLRLFLSSNNCYVGEPVTMTVTWFVGKDVNGFEFQLPILDDPRFALAPLPAQSGGSSQEEIKIPLGKESVIGVKGKGEIQGREFLTVTFHFLLLAKEAGAFTLPQATVACQTLSSLRSPARRSPFGGFDDFFSSGREAVYRTQIVPSNEPALTVAALPEKDKPADFSGLVGHYSIAASASPQEMNLGDPITLTLTISGPFAQGAKLPDLSGFLPPAAFKVPEDIAPGELGENRKIFTQTIRVKDTAITEIPTIVMSYFDPEQNSYQTAQTAPIPLTVRATRIVTATDAEGRDAGVSQQELKAAEKGLACNYEGEDVLIDQREQLSSGTGWRILLIAGPPALFLLTALLSLARKRRTNDSVSRQARVALGRLERRLASPSLSPDDLAASLKEYLETRLHKSVGALTFLDVEPGLLVLGVDEATRAELKDLLALHEAWRYAGQGSSIQDIGQVTEKTLLLARKLEPWFRQKS